MPDLDEYLRHELRRTVRRTDTNDVSSQIDRRRSRRARGQKVQAVALTVVVLGTTLGGVAVLSRVFREQGRTPGGAVPLIENGLIVYSDVRNAGQHLWVVEPDGTGVRQLTTGDGTSDAGPSISPNGRTVAFTRTDEHGSSIYTIGIDGSGLTRLVGAPATDPTWSPDGSQIAFAGSPGGPYGIYLVDADGTNPRIVKGTGEISVGHPAWSPDGGSIAFEGTDGAPDSGATWDIYIAPVDGSGLIDITQTPDMSELGAAWSPDGSRILFARATTQVTTQGSMLMTMAPDPDTTPIALTDGSDGDRDPEWSPDGRSIVFARSTASGTAIYTILADGSDLTFVATNGITPAWQAGFAASELTTVPSPIPTDVPVELGLGFPVCNVQELASSGAFDAPASDTTGSTLSIFDSRATEALTPRLPRRLPGRRTTWKRTRSAGRR